MKTLTIDHLLNMSSDNFLYTIWNYAKEQNCETALEMSLWLKSKYSDEDIAYDPNSRKPMTSVIG